MQTKKTFRLLSFILFLGLFCACESNEEEPIDASVTSDAIEPLSIEMIENGSLGNKEQNKSAAIELAEWIGTGSDYGIVFTRIGDKVIEQEGTTKTIYNVENDTDNYLYVMDAAINSRWLALPKFSLGGLADVYLYKPAGTGWEGYARVRYEKRKFHDFMRTSADEKPRSDFWVIATYEEPNRPQEIVFIGGAKIGDEVLIGINETIPSGWVVFHTNETYDFNVMRYEGL